MSMLVRRSNLLVRVADAAAVRVAWQHHADAVTLDFDGAPAAIRAEFRAAAVSVAKGGAEVFARVGRETLRDDLDACVWPGLRGIVLATVESGAEIAAASAQLSALERARSLPENALQIIVLLETARGVWNIREILRESPRITQAGLDEARLAASMNFTPQPDIDPFVYARGRLAVEATAAGVHAIGITYPLSVAPKLLPAPEIRAQATIAKNLGMKGVICPFPEWVAPVNAAFTPTPELVEWNRRVREAFAAGVAAGTAAVPLDGKMIDVPVDEWAIVVLAMAEACARRDAEKRAALGR